LRSYFSFFRGEKLRIMNFLEIFQRRENVKEQVKYKIYFDIHT